MKQIIILFASILLFGNLLKAQCTPPPPIPTIAFNPTTPCGGYDVILQASPSDPNMVYSWTFDDGTTDALYGDIAVHQFPTVNIDITYTIELTITDMNGCTSMTTKPITILGTPDFDVVGNFSACLPSFSNQTTFTTNLEIQGGEPGATYNWFFGDGGVLFNSPDLVVPHTYTNYGTYNLVVQSSNGTCLGSFEQEIIFYKRATANMNVLGSTDICEGDTIFIENNTDPSEVNFYVWDFGNGERDTVYNNDDLSYIYEFDDDMICNSPPIAGAELDITLIAVNDCLSHSNSTPIYVALRPRAIIEEPDILLASNPTHTFNNLSCPSQSSGYYDPNTYVWNFGDGTTGTGANPQHTFSGVGTYTVTMTATNQCGSDTDSIEVTVADDPLATISFNPTSPCGGTDVILSASPADPNMTYSWTFDDGMMDTLHGDIVVYQFPVVETDVTYNIELIITDANGFISTTSTPITILATPAFEVTGTFAACLPSFSDVTNFTTNLQIQGGEPGATYNWFFGDGQALFGSTDLMVSHTYSAYGTYNLIVQTSNGTCLGSFEQEITFYKRPTASMDIQGSSDICEGDLIILQNNTNPSEVNFYVWDFGNGERDTVYTNDDIPYVYKLDDDVVCNSPPQAGAEFDITLIAVNDCFTHSNSTPVYVSLLPRAIIEEPSILCASNPTHTFNNLSCPSQSSGYFDSSTYAWDFGDGTTGTGLNPEHTFPGIGTYAVTMTATNQCGSKTDTVEVTVVDALAGGGNTGDCISDLILTGSLDGPLPGGTKVVEIYVQNDIADLSIFGLGFANNGGGTNGQEYTFPAIPAYMGDFLYVTNDQVNFNNYLGFDADFVDSDVSGFNGNDAIELYKNNGIIDVFGNASGNAEAEGWYYEDSWVYRLSGTGPDMTFVETNWDIQSANMLDGTATNIEAMLPFPYGTYNNGCFNYIYVDANATGANTGSNWVDAYTDLQSALAAVAGDCPSEIRMAAGTYYPVIGSNRGISFNLKDDLTILGGYPSGGGTRNPTLNETILSGNIDGIAGYAGNSYHVVKAQNISNVKLDGLIIRDGNANNAASFGRSRGGGLYVVGSEIEIINSDIKWNKAIYGGGLFATLSPNVTIRSSILRKNTATNGAALYHSNQTNMYLLNSKVINNTANGRCAIEINNSLYTAIENSVIANNASANANAIAFIATNRNQFCEIRNSTILGENQNKYLMTMQVGYNDALDLDIYNSIVAHQDAAFDKIIIAYNNNILDLNTRNCYIQGQSVIGNSNNNLYSDIDGALVLNSDYSLSPCSPGVNAGNNVYANSYDRDVVGNNRFFGIVDIGAFEAQSSCLIPREMAGNNITESGVAVQVYPNPVKDILNIETSFKELILHVFDGQGKRVMLTTQREIDMSSLPKGMYYINGYAEGKLVLSEKVFKHG